MQMKRAFSLRTQTCSHVSPVSSLAFMCFQEWSKAQFELKAMSWEDERSAEVNKYLKPLAGKPELTQQEATGATSSCDLLAGSCLR